MAYLTRMSGLFFASGEPTRGSASTRQDGDACPAPSLLYCSVFPTIAAARPLGPPRPTLLPAPPRPPHPLDCRGRGVVPLSPPPGYPEAPHPPGRGNGRRVPWGAGAARGRGPEGGLDLPDVYSVWAERPSPLAPRARGPSEGQGSRPLTSHVPVQIQTPVLLVLL